MDTLVTVKTFSLPQQAYIIKGRLESEGIPCFLQDELTVQTMNFYSNTIGGVKLQVRVQDLSDAVMILEQEGYLSERDFETPDSLRWIQRWARRTEAIPLLGRWKAPLRLAILLALALLALALLGYWLLLTLTPANPPGY